MLKVQNTINKIENVIATNFDKSSMKSLWVSYVSDDRRFCDVIYALSEHYKNSDNDKFIKKLEKTAISLGLPKLVLTPFLIKYFIVWSENNKIFDEHLKKLVELKNNGELEDKTNINQLIENGIEKNRKNSSIDNEQKKIISSIIELTKFDFNFNYISFINNFKKGDKDNAFKNYESLVEFGDQTRHKDRNSKRIRKVCFNSKIITKKIKIHKRETREKIPCLYLT